MTPLSPMRLLLMQLHMHDALAAAPAALLTAPRGLWAYFGTVAVGWPAG
jgi:hypothetical protein